MLCAYRGWVHGSPGQTPRAPLPAGQRASYGYQVDLAAAVRRETGVPTSAVGLIVHAAHAERILREGACDLVALARTVLYDPRWPWHASAHLGASVKVAPQYLRCQPRQFRELFEA